jgi:hypothetical protein
MDKLIEILNKLFEAFFTLKEKYENPREEVINSIQKIHELEEKLEENSLSLIEARKHKKELDKK